jgi:hypothetical protein
MRFVRNTSLSLFFLTIFVVSVVGQAVVGHDLYNDEEVEHARLTHDQPHELTLARYVLTSRFGQSLMENWQSEYLQFSLFILATIYLLQRGSTESKELDNAGRESDEQQLVGEHARPASPASAKAGGLRRWIFSHSLLITMGLIFCLAWFAQSVTGWSAFNADQLEHKGHTLSWLGYATSSSFWFDTLQNWQSEFLAVGSMAVFSIYLRERGSPESKPVGAPHATTGVEG